MNQKIKKLRDNFSSIQIDGMIVSNPTNIRYLTGLTAEGTLIINNKENIFITDGRYIEEVNNMITIDDEITSIDYVDLDENDYFKFFEECNRVGLEENYITYAKYTETIRKYRIKEAVETDNIIEKMRMIKDENEIMLIEKACNITDSCFLHIIDFIKVGMTEKQIAFEIEKFFIENGADGKAFDSVVASGINSSKPHATPTDKKIEEGDPILLDFGAKYKGYCADMSRTIFVGKVSDEDKNLYELLLKIQERAFNKYKNNAEGNQIAKGVQDDLYPHKLDLIHALGHGVGLDIHEKPIISTKRACTLKENMVVTNEPGAYVPGKIGIRIEDTVLVNNMSATVLTKSNKNLLVI